MRAGDPPPPPEVHAQAMTDHESTDTAEWIGRLGLLPHPEGGWYRELHRSDTCVSRNEDGAPRSGLTLIAYLLGGDELSRWHRVQGADEVWHHGGGDPLQLWRLAPEGGEAEALTLGPLDRRRPAQVPVQVIPSGWWQAARSSGDWSLAYCCVGPGFDFADFMMLRHGQHRPPGALAHLL
jgi:predicted cupin superfamily sugar epimerase